MTNPKKQKALEKSTIKTDKIKLSVSDTNLSDKVFTNIIDPKGAVYWYIRFNTILDSDSVSKFTMNITETNGYIIDSIITYDTTRNLIVLNPTDLYRKNEYYMLNISENVRSAKGRPLGKSVHILFKILGADKISEFEVLKDNAAIPIAREKPKNIRKAEMAELARFKAFTEGMISPKGLPVLPQPQMPSVNIFPAFFGVMAMLLSILFGSTSIIILSVAISVFGVFHLIRQLKKDIIRSDINYIFGVNRFNKGLYAKALSSFTKAAKLNPENSLAQLAAIKTKKHFK